LKRQYIVLKNEVDTSLKKRSRSRTSPVCRVEPPVSGGIDPCHVRPGFLTVHKLIRARRKIRGTVLLSTEFFRNKGERSVPITMITIVEVCLQTLTCRSVVSVRKRSSVDRFESNWILYDAKPPSPSTYVKYLNRSIELLIEG
jgi:hypothetical protein